MSPRNLLMGISNEVTDSLSQRYIILEYSKHMIITQFAFISMNDHYFQVIFIDMRGNSVIDGETLCR